MCYLHSLIKGQQVMRESFRTSADSCGNLPARPEIFPDQMAPVIHTTSTGRELTTMR